MDKTIEDASALSVEAILSEYGSQIRELKANNPDFGRASLQRHLNISEWKAKKVLELVRPAEVAALGVQALALSNEMPVYSGEGWDTAVETFRNLDESIVQHQWMLGAIAAHLGRTYGEGDIKRFAFEVGCSARRIYQLAETYDFWKDKTRSKRLSYTHHQLLAENKVEDAEEWLGAAEDREYSSRDLKREIKRVYSSPDDEPSDHDEPYEAEYERPAEVVDIRQAELDSLLEIASAARLLLMEGGPEIYQKLNDLIGAHEGKYGKL